MKRDESVSVGETVLDPSGRGPSRVSASPPAGPGDLAVDHSDRYQLGGTEAAGGIGRVVRAQDRRLHRTVAVKELLERTPSAEARFVREALITARLEHPGVVPIYDAARWPSGEPYYSMKLVSGRTLKELIEARPALDARLALVPNVIAVAEAVAYAHSRQVIHRDLKPANIIVGDFGETVVIDWGLAKDLSGRVAEPEPATVDPTGATLDSSSGSGTGSDGPVTVAGNIMGTPAYMAPEQARGEEVDARADVYALGAILYEVLSGQPPHAGRTNQEILARAVIGEVPPLDPKLAIPADLAAIVTKALARGVADRYPDAAPLADDLRRFQTGQLVTARQYSTGTLVRRWIARHRGIVALAAVFTAALAVTGVVAVRRVVAERDVAERERGFAQAMRAAAEDRTFELVFRQAEGVLSRDPTATLAALKVYPVDGRRATELPALVDEAVSAGVARHVLRVPEGVHELAIAGGSLVILDEKGGVRRWTLDADGAHASERDATPAVKLSPDGAWVIRRRSPGAFELAPVAGGAAHPLEGKGNELACWFSADSRRLITIDEAMTLRAWDVATGTTLRTVDGARNATLDDTGATLAWREPTGAVRVGPIEGGPARVVAQTTTHPFVLKLSPDGHSLLLHQHGQEARLIAVGTGKSVAIAGGGNPVETAAFSQRGDRLVLGRHDGTVSVVRVADGKDVPMRGHEDPVLAVAFLHDDSTVVSASDDSTVRVWDLATSESRVLRGHTDDVDSLAVAPDGRTIATGSLDGSVRVWSLDRPAETARRVAQIAGPGNVRLTYDGRWFFTQSEGGGLEWFDRETGKHARFAREDWGWIHPTGYGRDLLSLAGPKGVGLWSPVDGTLRVLSSVHEKPVVTAAIDEQARTAVSAGEDGNVVVWDVATGRGRVVRRGAIALAVAFMPGGSQFAVCGKGWLELWDARAGALVRAADLAKYPGNVCPQLIPSGDGTTVYAASLSNPVLFRWRVAGTEVQAIDFDAIATIAVSPDGRRLAIGRVDRSVDVLDTETGKTRLLGAHGDLVFQMNFSPDGRTLATASNDRTVRLWDLATGRARVLRASRGFGAVVFGRDGGTVSAATLDGVVHTWSLPDLPRNAPEDTQPRIRAATTAVIDTDGKPTTPSEGAR
ncbi:MAG TPA: WD40 repeat domain-containing serine/threonine protein kinase [Kofleriaceae bacterium]|nr:WD40 repeat domain-containing serine/threonine protein kinase [Kofleriaceae bacterium]